MKTIVTLVGLFAIAELTGAADIPIFVKSLENLHRGPPFSTDSKIEGRISSVKTKWFKQKLDHFDELNNQTWHMRYMENGMYLEDGGPIFILLGGEWSIQENGIKNGILVDLAQEHKGMLFYTEHRYYGQSRCTSDLSSDNLQKYLHVKQALADVAHFIRHQRETDPRLTNSKVIITGCSYSATMVVWFSKLYPDLVAGGWASSAPILAKVDFKEYKEVTGRAIRELGSQGCYNRVKNGIAELEAMFDGKRSAEAKAMLQLCNSFDHKNDLDLWSLFRTISNIHAGVVQYQKNSNVSDHCDYLMSFPDDLTAVASYFVKKATDGNGCVDVTYRSILYYYWDISYRRTPSRPWFFQTCNEYGWYQSSTSKEQPFGTKFPATLELTFCRDIFGTNYTNEHIHQLVAETNKNFGGLNPQVKNVYMTHGGLDPWSALGNNESHGASVIPRASHCADFDSINNTDSSEMRASKQRLVELVRKWLS